MPIFISDHGPILLDTSPVNPTVRRPYKLELWCLEFAATEAIIKEEWGRARHGSRLFRCQRKLESIRRGLRNWCIMYRKENLIQ